ncbi:MAG: hypothetical protein HYX86_01120 [Chloroflexi bacterium]|nr:hypothetical protein [Chloroflexota bacterium]
MVWLMKEEEREAQLPEEWGGIVPSQVFLEEAERIVVEGEKQGITLRCMGGVSVRLRAPQLTEAAQRLGRLATGQQEFTDLDFMSYGRFLGRMKGFFTGLGYSKRKATLSSAASHRQIYFHPQGWFFVDVFFDWLRVANHPLDFRGRLELDSPTIPASDLLLEKLQIVNLSEKDLKDTLVILLAHPISEGQERGKIDSGYISRLLAKDWGFWYTVTTNLDGLEKVLATLPALTGEEKQTISSRVRELGERIEAEPKSLRWKTRGQIGTRMRWYEAVETEETVGEFGIWRMAAERPKAEPPGQASG